MTVSPAAQILGEAVFNWTYTNVCHDLDEMAYKENQMMYLRTLAYVDSKPLLFWLFLRCQELDIDLSQPVRAEAIEALLDLAPQARRTYIEAKALEDSACQNFREDVRQLFKQAMRVIYTLWMDGQKTSPRRS